jgi:hypothetical protein
MKKKNHNHMTSLRLPNEWHAWIAQFAADWHATPAFIYRAAVREFIINKRGVLK